MRAIKKKAQQIANNVKTLFQNPHHHYTFVVLNSKGLLYFHDEKLMSCIPISNTFPVQDIKFLSFSLKYGQFVAYVQEVSTTTGRPSPFILHFQLNGQGKISSCRHFLKEKPITYDLSLAIMTARNIEESNEELILTESTRYRVVSFKGETLRTQEIRLSEGLQVNASKVHTLKEGKQVILLLVQNKALLKGQIRRNYSSFTKAIKFDEQVSDVFVDSAVKKRYLGVQTKSNKLMIFSLHMYKLCQTLNIPGLCIASMCFFYPGVNTSPTNHLKDKVFLVFQGVAGSLPSITDKQSIYINQNYENLPYFKPNSLYIYQFQQFYISSSCEIQRLKLLREFVLEETERIKDLFINEHQMNCVRVISQSQMLISYNLSDLFGGENVDEEWLYLTHKFRYTGENIDYQEKEGEFQNDFWRHHDLEVTQEDLNDWSYSLFSHEEIQDLKVNRRLSICNINYLFQ